MADPAFVRATKRLCRPEHLEVFRQSPACDRIRSFVKAINTAVKGQPASQCTAAPTGATAAILAMLEQFDRLIDETPAVAAGARFGNPAFRQWCAKMEAAAPAVRRSGVPARPGSPPRRRNAGHRGHTAAGAAPGRRRAAGLPAGRAGDPPLPPRTTPRPPLSSPSRSEMRRGSTTARGTSWPLRRTCAACPSSGCSPRPRSPPSGCTVSRDTCGWCSGCRPSTDTSRSAIPPSRRRALPALRRPRRRAAMASGGWTTTSFFRANGPPPARRPPWLTWMPAAGSYVWGSAQLTANGLTDVGPSDIPSAEVARPRKLGCGRG